MKKHHYLSIIFLSFLTIILVQKESCAYVSFFNRDKNVEVTIGALTENQTLRTRKLPHFYDLKVSYNGPQGKSCFKISVGNQPHSNVKNKSRSKKYRHFMEQLVLEAHQVYFLAVEKAKRSGSMTITQADCDVLISSKIEKKRESYIEKYMRICAQDISNLGDDDSIFKKYFCSKPSAPEFTRNEGNSCEKAVASIIALNSNMEERNYCQTLQDLKRDEVVELRAKCDSRPNHSSLRKLALFQSEFQKRNQRVKSGSQSRFFEDRQRMLQLKRNRFRVLNLISDKSFAIGSKSIDTADRARRLPKFVQEPFYKVGHLIIDKITQPVTRQSEKAAKDAFQEKMALAEKHGFKASEKDLNIAQSQIKNLKQEPENYKELVWFINGFKHIKRGHSEMRLMRDGVKMADLRFDENFTREDGRKFIEKYNQIYRETRRAIFNESTSVPSAKTQKAQMPKIRRNTPLPPIVRVQDRSLEVRAPKEELIAPPLPPRNKPIEKPVMMKQEDLIPPPLPPRNKPIEKPVMVKGEDLIPPPLPPRNKPAATQEIPAPTVEVTEEPSSFTNAIKLKAGEISLKRTKSTPRVTELEDKRNPTELDFKIQGKLAEFSKTRSLSIDDLMAEKKRKRAEEEKKAAEKSNVTKVPFGRFQLSVSNNLIEMGKEKEALLSAIASEDEVEGASDEEWEEAENDPYSN